MTRRQKALFQFYGVVFFALLVTLVSDSTSILQKLLASAFTVTFVASVHWYTRHELRKELSRANRRRIAKERAREEAWREAESEAAEEQRFQKEKELLKIRPERGYRIHGDSRHFSDEMREVYGGLDMETLPDSLRSRLLLIREQLATPPVSEWVDTPDELADLLRDWQRQSYWPSYIVWGEKDVDDTDEDDFAAKLLTAFDLFDCYPSDKTLPFDWDAAWVIIDDYVDKARPKFNREPLPTGDQALRRFNEEMDLMRALALFASLPPVHVKGRRGNSMQQWLLHLDDNDNLDEHESNT